MAYYSLSSYPIMSVGGVPMIGIVDTRHLSGISLPYAIEITHPGASRVLSYPSPIAVHVPVIPSMMYSPQSGHIHPMHARSVIDSIVDRQVGRSKK